MSSYHENITREYKQKKHRVGGNIWNNGYVCLDIDCLKKRNTFF